MDATLAQQAVQPGSVGQPCRHFGSPPLPSFGSRKSSPASSCEEQAKVGKQGQQQKGPFTPKNVPGKWSLDE